LAVYHKLIRRQQQQQQHRPLLLDCCNVRIFGMLFCGLRVEVEEEVMDDVKGTC
jgi:hypothetical protein